MAGATPRGSYFKTLAASTTKSRLEQCWKSDINWDLYPDVIRKGCEQVGKAVSMPPTAVLSGLLILASFFMSHANVRVSTKEWTEPVILWISIGMPTGSGKSSLYKVLLDLIKMTREKVRAKEDLDEEAPSWLLEEATFEKMGVMMCNNYCKLLGLYDELSSFLTQINLCKAKGLSESHHLYQFLQMYNGLPWNKSTVSKGEANFEMERTSLTVGGFTQPAVAQSLIETSSNSEKGFSTRFLWIFPEPCYADFDTLEMVKPEFKESLANLFAKLWRDDEEPVHKLIITDRCLEIFTNKHDSIQHQLKDVAGTDELLSGMLSKSKGLILRVAGVLHALFRLDSTDDLPAEISVKALEAAINFVEVYCQHAAFIAAKGEVRKAIQNLLLDQVKEQPKDEVTKTATYVLTLPGKVLDISELNSKHKFRKYGNKPRAVAAIKQLEGKGLGEVIEKKCTRGAPLYYYFKKAPVPEEHEAKETFRVKLSDFGVSLEDYSANLLESPSKKKRSRDEDSADESDQTLVKKSNS